jgi:IPT/TIG domain
MSLGKRHIGRRVAGVGVAVALMVLGLQAPAYAVPAITGISPSSGPLGCVVVITGTGFAQPGAFGIDQVAFTGAGVISGAAAEFHVVSYTEIWTTVPAAPVAAQTGAITVTDTDATPDDTATSAVFTVTADAGTCTPTITSFTPTCGVVGSVVTITGTNLLSFGGDDADVTPPLDPPEGGEVRFNPYNAAAIASHTGAAESPTTLVVNVPANAVDGPIRVDTSLSAGDDNVDSTTAFNVAATADECVTTPTSHARSISFKITKAGKASGVVSSTEDPAFTDCVAAVPVKIQRKKSGVWKTVGKTTTNDSGAYTKKVKNPKGTQKFRALAPKVSLGDPVTDVCTKARSAVRKK